jgi:uncharacterized membrane protein
MNKLFIASAITFISIASQADIIKCSFTEPFVESTYSMAQQSLTYRTPGDDGKMQTKTIKNVSFQIKDAGKFEIVTKDGKVIQKLELNNRGSDGMSDNTYPYEVQDSSMMTSANSGWGGCSSNALKVKSSDEK